MGWFWEHSRLETESDGGVLDPVESMHWYLENLKEMNPDLDISLGPDQVI